MKHDWQRREDNGTHWIECSRCGYRAEPPSDTGGTCEQPHHYNSNETCSACTWPRWALEEAGSETCEPACDICGRELSEANRGPHELPLCARCASTAREAGRQEATRRAWAREGRPE